MNPFLFKAHPLLRATMGLVTGASSLGFREILGLIATYLAINLPLAAVLALRARKSLQIPISLPLAYLFALPATVLYMPIALTLLRDVARHAFRLDDRYLLLFALLVVTSVLAALFGIALRDRKGDPARLAAGLILALTLLVAGIPYGFLLLEFERLWGFFPFS